MRTAFGLLLVIGLAAGAVYQLRPPKSNGTLDVLLPGEVLDIRALDQRAVQELTRKPRDGCFVLWVMDPHCSGCRQLADRQGRRVAGLAGFYWLFAGSESAIDSFEVEFGLDPGQVLRLAPALDVQQGLRRAGVTATPSRLVVRSPDLMVVEVRVMNQRLLEEPDILDPAVCERRSPE